MRHSYINEFCTRSCILDIFSGSVPNFIGRPYTFCKNLENCISRNISESDLRVGAISSHTIKGLKVSHNDVHDKRGSRN